MESLRFIVNCSVPNNTYAIHEDFPLSHNMKASVESGFIIKAIGFNITCGILMTLLTIVFLNFEYEILKRKVKIKIESEKLQRILILLILLLILPLLFAFLIGAYLFKSMCSVLIKRKDKHFAGFLDSFDVFWSLEDDNTKSIINVLGVIEAESSNELIVYIKEKLQGIVQNNETEKLFYRRSEEYGFYYWRKCCYVDVNQYVRVIEVSNSTSLNVTDLEEIMTELSYQPLPFNDEGLFQILITNQKIDSCEEQDKYGIIFRIHHALGDGVALIETLCKVLADAKEEDSIIFSMPETYNENDKTTSTDFMKKIVHISKIPGCLIDGILRKPDRSTLHGPPLTGKKIYKWNESNENLFHMIKEIKDKAKDFNFSDILISALSCGLRDYFQKEIDPAPDNIAVILPIRLSQSKNSQLRLHNNFTVSILDVPIEGNMNDIKTRFNYMRCSADPLTNYYLLKICSILPKDILHPMFNSNQATMVFSNMPGPKDLSICGGAVKSLVFFVPNKGNTGLGVTALCYGGVLRLAAMVDSALISSSDELGLILDGMVNEIKRLHEEYGWRRSNETILVCSQNHRKDECVVVLSLIFK